MHAHWLKCNEYGIQVCRTEEIDAMSNSDNDKTSIKAR